MATTFEIILVATAGKVEIRHHHMQVSGVVVYMYPAAVL